MRIVFTILGLPKRMIILALGSFNEWRTTSYSECGGGGLCWLTRRLVDGWIQRAGLLSFTQLVIRGVVGVFKMLVPSNGVTFKPLCWMWSWALDDHTWLLSG